MSKDRDLFWKHLEPEHFRARAYCRRLMNNRDDGDDLYQDALVAALNGFESLRQPSSFRPWLYRIIINTFRNRLKQPWWKKVMSMTPVMAETTVGDNPLPRRAAERRLEAAFRALTPEDRALVTLFEVEGWPVEEISTMTGRSGGSVRVRLHRARGRMRRAVMKYRKDSGREIIINPSRSKDKVCVVHKPVED